MIRLLACVLLCAVGLQTVAAREQILEFYSDIEVRVDGRIEVTETIRVNAEHQKINRGIYRDFPTTYFGAFLTRSKVDFEVLSVQRNGAPEDHHSEDLSNGIRLYLGNRNRILPLGEHIYTIRYRTDRQIAFGETADEFYWNVTGNGWDFPILKARAIVHLPNEAHQGLISHEAWTGYQGATDRDYLADVRADEIAFTTTQRLEPHQGLTIRLSFPKGIVVQRGTALGLFIEDNLWWLLMMFTAAVLVVFYVLAWHRVGRDPERGVIVPWFYPPDDLSPGAMRYILDEKLDKKNFTAALISLAVKGRIDITRAGNDYLIKRSEEANQDASLSPGETHILNALLPGSRPVTLGKKYNKSIAQAMKKQHRILRREHHAACFLDNRIYAVIGIALSLLVMFFYWGHSNGFNPQFAHRIVAVLLIAGVTLWVLYRANSGITDALSTVFFVLMLVGGNISNLMHMPFEAIVLLSFLVLVNGLFIYLLKAPTPFGQELRDRIDGFKMYLNTAEQDRLDLLHPPERTPELFERYLPYAVALGVENRWAEQFADVLRAASQDGSYQPGWYHGGRFSTSNFSQSVSTLASSLGTSVAAASTPPSSSSGGGGGFSGGGGGGGGGGGW